MIWLAVCLCIATIVIQPDQAQADNRVALVIGNSIYQAAGSHSAALADAAVVTQALRGLGFSVTQRTNLTQSEMIEQLRTFVRTARLADTALLYFSGHAVSINERSYLIPTDALPTGLDAAGVELIELGALLRQLELGAGRNLIVLEVGERNRYTARLAELVARSREDSLHSTVNAFQPTPSVHLVVATSPEQSLPSENRQVSRFTQAFSRQLSKQGLTFSEVVETARDSVQTATNGRQVPWSVNGIPGTLRLNGAPLVAPPQVATLDGSKAAWDALQTSNIVEEYRAFVASYPDSPLRAAALERLLWLESLDEETQTQLATRTRSFRAMKRALGEAREEQLATITGLATSGYEVEPVFTEMIAIGDVALRSRPSGSGTWLGLLRRDERREVVGTVFGGSWAMIELDQAEIARVYSAVGQPVPEEPQRYGFISRRTLEVAEDGDFAVWEREVAQDNEVALAAFIEQFPNSVRRFDALQALIQLRYGDLVAAENAESTAGLGLIPPLARGNLDILPDIIAAPFRERDALDQQTAPAGSLADQADDVGAGQSDAPSGPEIVKIPEMGYSMELIEQEYVTKTRSNLRRLPWIKTRKLATVDADQRLVVTGRVLNENWYRVKWGDGRDLFVFGELVEPYAGSSLEAWENVQKSQDLADADAYLNSFPEGRHADKVLDLLQKSGALISNRRVSNLVRPQGTSATIWRSGEQVSDAQQVINVFPIIVDGVQRNELTQQAIAALGHRTGARVISDPDLVAPGAKVAVFDVRAIESNRREVAQSVIDADDAQVRDPDQDQDQRQGLQQGVNQDGASDLQTFAQNSAYSLSAVVQISLVDAMNASVVTKSGTATVAQRSRIPTVSERQRALRAAILDATDRLELAREG